MVGARPGPGVGMRVREQVTAQDVARALVPWGVASVTVYEDIATNETAFVFRTDGGTRLRATVDRYAARIGMRSHDMAENMAREVLGLAIEAMDPWEYLVRVYDNGEPPL